MTSENPKKDMLWEKLLGEQQQPVDKSFPDSSLVSRIQYDPSFETLIVGFKSSPVRYTYFDVPAGVVYNMLTAPSAGKYFHNFIKDNYTFVKQEKTSPIVNPTATNKVTGSI